MTAAVPNITDHSPDDPEAKIAPIPRFSSSEKTPINSDPSNF